MKFCSSCGGSLVVRVPGGDNLPRGICEGCGEIFYSNPKPIVGTLPLFEGRVLLCRRAIEPRHGRWTLPSGFMEIGETVEEGAARETWEEARAKVTGLRLFTVYSIPVKGQVYLLFLGELVDGRHAPGPESLETELFEPGQVPWDELAFDSVRFALRHWCEHGPDSGPHLGRTP